MISIELTDYAERQIDNIFSNNLIYSKRHFTQQFLNWNRIFHRYVNKDAISKYSLNLYGIYKIGTIGQLTYKYIRTDNVDIFEIVEFQFSQLPYSEQGTDNSSSQTNTSEPQTKQNFILPAKMIILKGKHYGGLKIGYYNRRYVILKQDNTPLVEKWFEEKPKIFRQPFGKYNIIAHVSYCKSLYSVSINGNMYDTGRLWKSAYLEETISTLLKQILSERRKSISEGKNDNRIILKEQELISVINEVVCRLIA